jgi:hypothetical protein
MPPEDGQLTETCKGNKYLQIELHRTVLTITEAVSYISNDDVTVCVTDRRRQALDPIPGGLYLYYYISFIPICFSKILQKGEMRGLHPPPPPATMFVLLRNENIFAW